MNISTFQEKSRRTMNKDMEHRDLVINMVLGLAGETGEVVDQMKKHLYHGHRLDEEGLIEELGDVMFYLVNLADLYQIDMDKVLQYNYKKLLERYPEGFDEERSINRD